MKEIGITSSSTQLGINGGMKSMSLCTNIGMSFLADKMGRRPMYLISVSTDTLSQTTPYGVSITPPMMPDSSSHTVERWDTLSVATGEDSLVRCGFGGVPLFFSPTPAIY
jgi:hypothetical protein